MVEINKSIEIGQPYGLYNILMSLKNASLLTPTKVYYVSKGGNNQGGESWETAYTTLTAAITEQRRMRAMLPSAEQSVESWIIMAPGTYNENITTFPFSTNIVGLGKLGTDKATEIKPTAGAPLAGTVSGLGLYNMSFYHLTTATDCLDFNILNNCIIDGCEMRTDTNDAVAALSTEDCQNTIIRNCRVINQGGTTFEVGFSFTGGADKFFQACTVENNLIGSLDATGKGIYIASDACSGAESILKNNIIHLSGAGIGIDEDSNDVILIQNKVFTIGGTGFDANEDLAMDNIWNNGTATVDYPNLT